MWIILALLLCKRYISRVFASPGNPFAVLGVGGLFYVASAGVIVLVPLVVVAVAISFWRTQKRPRFPICLGGIAHLPKAGAASFDIERRLGGEGVHADILAPYWDPEVRPMLLTVTIFFARSDPKAGSRFRPFFNLVHHWRDGTNICIENRRIFDLVWK